jgi:Ricin-type beta-trefoil lectin domain
MTSPDRPGAPDGPEALPTASTPSAGEPSAQGVASAPEPAPSMLEPGYQIAPGGGSFAAGFARQHFFSGARFLKPGRRAATAVAAVVGVAAVGVGLTAAVAHFSGDYNAAAEPAASTSTLATSSPTLTPTHEVTVTPSKHAATHPHRQAKPKPPAGIAPPPPPPPVAQFPPPAPIAPPPVHDPSGGSSKPPAPPKPTAHPITFQGAFIINFGSNRCLGSQGGSSVPGAQVVLADCDESDPSQGWTFPSDGTARDFGGTMCLDISGAPGDGTPVRIADCSSSRHSTQAFVLKPSYDLVEVQPDLCVDAKDKNTAAGTVMQMWSCTGNANQKFRMP